MTSGKQHPQGCTNTETVISKIDLRMILVAYLLKLRLFQIKVFSKFAQIVKDKMLVWQEEQFQ